jgi:hypothetical protein
MRKPILARFGEYLQSRRFKDHIYLGGVYFMMGYVTFLLFTLDKPFFNNKRAETAGFDNYDDDNDEGQE